MRVRELTQVLCKSNKFPKLLSHFSRPSVAHLAQLELVEPTLLFPLLFFHCDLGSRYHISGLTFKFKMLCAFQMFTNFTMNPSPDVNCPPPQPRSWLLLPLSFLLLATFHPHFKQRAIHLPPGKHPWLLSLDNVSLP